MLEDLFRLDRVAVVAAEDSIRGVAEAAAFPVFLLVLFAGVLVGVLAVVSFGLF
jgi:hypothetical protein